MEKYRVRFAPSPTGPLHIGGARSALFNYLLAKKHHGQFVVRIEDTDLERSSRASEADIFASLDWLGLTADESVQVGGPYAPYRQTERLADYTRVAEALLAAGKAYHCFCTPEEIEAEREIARSKNAVPMYSGKCRHLSPEKAAARLEAGDQPVVRFHVPLDETISIKDEVRGHVSFDSNGIGDFIIVKKDGIPTYNFAVVVDDHLMEITHVIRAEEHLSNTPRQVALYQALGWATPTFGHVSLILGEDKKKMSKRHGATSVVQYAEMGYLPEALFNFLALLGWSPGGEEEVMDQATIIAKFELADVSKSPAVFDMEKLKWLNGHYIRQISPEELAKRLLPFLQKAGYLSAPLSAADEAWLVQLATTLQEKIHLLTEVVDFMPLFVGDDVKMENDEAAEILADPDVPVVIGALKSHLSALTDWTPETIKPIFKAITKETGHKGKKVFMPIRVALTGQMHGPDLQDIIALQGLPLVLARLAKTCGDA